MVAITKIIHGFRNHCEVLQQLHNCHLFQITYAPRSQSNRPRRRHLRLLTRSALNYLTASPTVVLGLLFQLVDVFNLGNVSLRVYGAGNKRYDRYKCSTSLSIRILPHAFVTKLLTVLSFVISQDTLRSVTWTALTQWSTCMSWTWCFLFGRIRLTII
jgi:hypothetical protein